MGGGKEGKLWLGCKINEKSLINKKKRKYMGRAYDSKSEILTLACFGQW